MGVALWLCPRKNTPLHDKLTTLMGSLNSLFPDQPPKFEPHITITTNVDVNLEDSNKTRDDVNKILSASVVALHSLPKNHSNLVTLGRIDSQRKFFKKLYFQVVKDPNLLSFARIIREIFVITPQQKELENQKLNPQLYTKDNNGNTIRRKASKKNRSQSKEIAGSVESEVKQVNMDEIRARSTYLAAQWSLEEFDPHLSLVYSDIYNIDKALWRTIKTRVSDFLNIDNCDSLELTDSGLGWDGGVLKLMLCEGDVGDWIELGSVDVH